MADFFTAILRKHLAKHFGDDHRMTAHFEEQAQTLATTSEAASSTAQTTDAMRDATVIVLSQNTEFSNERLLRRGAGISMYDTGAALIVELSGQMKVLTDPASLFNAVDDAAAAAGGVEVGQFYRNGSVIMARIA